MNHGFSNFLGNKKTVSRIKRALKDNRFSHACIFYGQEGVGKRHLATVIAASMNCEETGLEPCNTCNSCYKISKGIHPDVEIIEPGEKGSIKVDTIREISKKLNYRPYEGDRSVLIIDGAETMTREAANSFLKRLEEPPEYANIFLITITLNDLLDTVKSRCRQYYFKGVSPEKIENFLIEEKGIEKKKAEKTALFANNSIGKALDLKIDDYEKRRERFGKMIQKILKDDTSLSFEDIHSQFSTNSIEIAEELKILSEIYRDAVILISDASEDLIVNSELKSVIEEIAGCYTLKNAREVFERIKQSIRDIQIPVNRKIVLDNLVIDLKNFSNKHREK